MTGGIQGLLFDETPKAGKDPWAYDPWALPAVPAAGERPSARRRPSWLTRFCEDSPDRLKPVRCACGQWVIGERGTIWASWDPGVVSGRDVLIARILNRMLCRIHWNPALGRVTLRTVMHAKEDDGEYLALHECGKPPLSETAFRRRRTKPVLGRADGYSPPIVSEQEVRRLEHVWHTPYGRLAEERGNPADVRRGC